MSENISGNQPENSGFFQWFIATNFGNFYCEDYKLFPDGGLEIYGWMPEKSSEFSRKNIQQFALISPPFFLAEAQHAPALTD